MLIISKFRDYYDSASAYGIDKDCVYNRIIEDINKVKRNYNYETDYTTKDYDFKLSNHLIGFCGQMYRCTKVIQQHNYHTSDKQTLAFYDAPSLIAYMKVHDIGLKGQKFRWRHAWTRDNYKTEDGIREYFDREVKKEMFDIFRNYHTPIFIKEVGDICNINACLKDFKFGKIKDAATAFQEIHQYMAGVLGNIEKDTIDIPDKTRIQQHGFDKWSFRKHRDDNPTSTKKKRKKKKISGE